MDKPVTPYENVALGAAVFYLGVKAAIEGVTDRTIILQYQQTPHDIFSDLVVVWDEMFYFFEFKREDETIGKERIQLFKEMMHDEECAGVYSKAHLVCQVVNNSLLCTKMSSFIYKNNNTMELNRFLEKSNVSFNDIFGGKFGISLHEVYDYLDCNKKLYDERSGKTEPLKGYYLNKCDSGVQLSTFHGLSELEQKLQDAVEQREDSEEDMD